MHRTNIYRVFATSPGGLDYVVGGSDVKRTAQELANKAIVNGHDGVYIYNRVEGRQVALRSFRKV